MAENFRQENLQHPAKRQRTGLGGGADPAVEISKPFCRVRGGGGAVAVIDYLLKELGLRAFDCQTGDFFTAASAEGSFAEWRAFRDRVISAPRPEEQ